MYFKEFPRFLYDFKKPDGTTETQIVRDITRNVRFRKEILENITLFDEYDVMDGETPEIIAEKVYGNPKYHWVIMLANQRYDYINDFPKEETSLAKCIECTFNPQITAESWSYSGTTITVTTATPHGLRLSPTVTLIVSGATADTNAPNGTFTAGVTSVDTYTFTFEASAVPTGTAGGTMLINTLNRQYYIDHYLDANGLKVDSDYPGAVSVTCDQMARDENEKLRRIKLISNDALKTILQNYRDLM